MLASPGSMLRGYSSTRLQKSVFIISAPIHRPSTQVACNSITDQKKAAAQLFCSEFVRNNQVIGTGSGELSSLVIESIGTKLASGQLKGVRAVAMSTMAAAEGAFRGVPSHENPAEALQAGLDLAFEEADQLDMANNACIIGTQAELQQPALLQTFTAVKRAKKFVLLCNQNNVVERLKGPLPVLIEDATWEETAEEVDDLVVGDAEVTRRPKAGLPNPDFKGGDHPYVSDEGHNIIDIHYDPDIRLIGEQTTYSEVLESLTKIPGVVLTGMLLGLAQAVVVVRPQGPEVIHLGNQQT